MGFPAWPIAGLNLGNGFQSLVGVYGFSRKIHEDDDEFDAVSIPSRGLWVFPQSLSYTACRLLSFNP